MSYLEIAKRAQAKLRQVQNDFPVSEQTDITEGRIVAVEICSNVVEAHIWLAFDDHFKTNDGQAVFYADELPFLATKDVGTLREIHKVKLAFGLASRVRQ